jgi:hypothetical protein
VHSVLLALVTFISPAAGSQVIGAMPIEITTTAANVDRVEFYVDGKLAGVARKTPYRIGHDFGTSLEAHEVSAKVFSDQYKIVQTARVMTAALSAAETISVDLVEVPLRVHASSQLKATDLRLNENGVEQTIRNIQVVRPAANFSFVIDRSLSMGEGRFDEALRAVRGELHMLREGDTASVVSLQSQRVEAGCDELDAARERDTVRRHVAPRRGRLGGLAVSHIRHRDHRWRRSQQRADGRTGTSPYQRLQDHCRRPRPRPAQRVSRTGGEDNRRRSCRRRAW